jgi:acetyl-CoA carboxylase biotin carboxyl carrier protein
MTKTARHIPADKALDDTPDNSSGNHNGQSMSITDIQSIIKDFEASSLMTLELTMKDVSIRLSKNKTEDLTPKPSPKKNAPDQKDPSPSQFEPTQSDSTDITSPLVGTYYHSDAPGKAPFVKVGQKVAKGDVLCLVEAMKIMNEIVAPSDGVISDIIAKDGEAVGYGSVLMRLGEAR